MAESYRPSQIVAVLQQFGFTPSRRSSRWLVLILVQGNDPPAIVLRIVDGRVRSYDLARQLERLGENPEPYFAELDAMG